MQRQLRDTIQSKYGVSSKTSNQVIKALTEIEKHRQGAAPSLPGRPGTQQNEQAPNIESIVGGLQAGGILGLIITLLKRLFGSGRGGQSQGSQDVMNILSDLMGDATHPGQAPDLASILLGLLGSGGSTTGSGGQSADIEELVMSLLGGQRSSRGGGTSQKPR